MLMKKLVSLLLLVAIFVLATKPQPIFGCVGVTHLQQEDLCAASH